MMKRTDELINELKNGEYNEKINSIYVSENAAKVQIPRYIDAVNAFEYIYGRTDVEIYSAPGRSEICGNHTDHQHGKVIAASVNIDAIGVAALNNSSEVHILSEGYKEIVVNINDLELRADESANPTALVKGIIKRLIETGYKAGGMNVYITSDVPEGSGLSSSAAFEILIGTIVSGLFNNMEISGVDIAKAGQYAERTYFGKPCGLMDQLGCAVGGAIAIDFKEETNPVIEKLDLCLDKNDISMCIFATGSSHENLTDEYAKVPAEMILAANYMGKDVLREVNEEEFVKAIPMIRAKYGDRVVLRALHFFREERNVDSAALALKASDINEFFRAIRNSGDSSFEFLQNVYSNKDIQCQDLSVAIAVTNEYIIDSGVCRVHGGGFAGTIQAFMKDELVSEYQKRMYNIFDKGVCYCLKVRKYGGVKVM